MARLNLTPVERLQPSLREAIAELETAARIEGEFTVSAASSLADLKESSPTQVVGVTPQAVDGAPVKIGKHVNATKTVITHLMPEDMQDILMSFFGEFGKDVPARLAVKSIDIDEFPDAELADGIYDKRGIEYAKGMIGKKVPPVVVYGDIWLDGRHRVWAAKMSGAKTIDAIDIRDYLPEEAMDVIEPIGTLNRRNQTANPEIRNLPNLLETSAFKAWFRDSKVVDEAGKPLVVYHGARPGTVIERFKARHETDGIYFTPDIGYAEAFTEDLSTDTVSHGAVYPVYLCIQNPLVVVAEYGSDEWNSFVDRGLNRVTLKKQGYDGAILREPNGTIDQIIAFEPEQIESAIGNKSTFGPTNPDIRYNRRQYLGENENFRSWFGRSKVVDAEGKPMVVYHGTRRDFSVFDAAATAANPWLLGDDKKNGFFFTKNPGTRSDSGQWGGAAGYAGSSQRDGETVAASGANVMPVYLALQSPYKMSADEYRNTAARPDFAEELEVLGYDGVAIDDGTFVAFHPEQIKSATGNSGAFDPANPDIRFSRKPVTNVGDQSAQLSRKMTETPAFKAWFRDSKVVDAEGGPLVVYHGTYKPRAKFTKAASFFTTSAENASDYAADRAMYRGGGQYESMLETGAQARGATVQPVYLSIKNPLTVDANGGNWKFIDFDGSEVSTDDLVEIAKARGNDGLYVRNVIDTITGRGAPADTFAAFHPSQIKSSTGNSGAFDPANPDIRFSRKPVTYVGDQSAQLSRKMNETPAFKKWFGDSKVVDEQGRPLVVYHGTDKDFSEFTVAKGDLGIHFGSVEAAHARLEAVRSSRQSGSEHVMPAYLSIKKPLRMPDAGDWDNPDRVATRLGDMIVADDDFAARYEVAEAKGGTFREILERMGYDGVVYDNVAEGGGDSYIAFRPEQIKSSIGNNGNFNSASADIRFGRSAVENRAQGRRLLSGPQNRPRFSKKLPLRVDVSSEIETVRVLADFFHADVAIIRTTEDSTLKFDGASYNGRIWLHESCRRPLHTLFGHELVHQMRRDRPDLYKGLRDAIVPLVRHRERFAKQAGVDGRDRAYIDEELVGDIVGDRFSEKSFWRAVAGASQATFKDTAGYVSDTINRLLVHLEQVSCEHNSLGSAIFVSDLDKAREAIVQVVSEYAHWMQETKPGVELRIKPFAAAQREAPDRADRLRPVDQPIHAGDQVGIGATPTPADGAGVVGRSAELASPGMTTNSRIRRRKL